MKCKDFAVNAFIAVMTIGLFSVVSAQRPYFSGSFDGGVSQPVGGFANRYNTGFNVGTSWFFWPVEPVGLGIRFSYDRWGIDEGNVTAEASKVIGAPIVNPVADGSANIIGMIPSLRVGTGVLGLPFNFDAQIGYGLYLLRDRATVTGSALGGGSVSTIVGDDGWNARSGFQLKTAIGIGPANMFNVNFVPIYNIIFHGKNTIQYFNGNLSLNFVF